MRNTSRFGIAAALAIASVIAAGAATAGEYEGSYPNEFAQQQKQKASSTTTTQAVQPANAISAK